MEDQWEECWEGIEALRPVSMMTARLLIVPLHPVCAPFFDDHLLGGTRCDGDAAIVVTGICSDIAYPLPAVRWKLQCCFFN